MMGQIPMQIDIMAEIDKVIEHGGWPIK